MVALRSALVVVAFASAARADVAPPPAAPPAAADGAEKAPKARKPSALLCGCASSRFLVKERGAVVVGDGSVAAWLHGESRLAGYKAEGGAVTPQDLPFVFDIDERSTGGASRLVKLRATGAAQGELGISRRGEERPRDLLSATLTPGAAAPATAAPSLKGLWLEPVEARERRDCGAWLTQRVAFQLTEGSAAVDAFVVTDLESGAVTVVDARHVGAFGIGRVDVCDHGVAVSNRPGRLQVQPMSSLGAVGEAWAFAHDGTGTTPVTREAWPKGADEDLLKDPYPTPGEPTSRFSWLSVGGMWILLPLTGLVAMTLAYIAWRLKRRRIAEVVCASCHKTVSVDVLDERTDGFFCPHCGASGMWKGNRVDFNVTRL